MLQHSQSIITDDDNPQFTDALDEFTFFDQPSISSSLHQDLTLVSISKPLPHSPALRRRPKQISKSPFKNTSDRLLDLHGDNRDDGFNVSPTKSYKLSKTHKLNEKLNFSKAQFGETISSLSSSAIINSGDDGSVNDQSVTVDSLDHSNSLDTDLNLVLALVRLIFKVISFSTNLLLAFVAFPIWLTHSSYMFVTDPFDVVSRVRRYAVRKVSRFFNFWLGKVKCIVVKCMKKKRLICKFCLQMGWGLVCSGLVGFMLVGLLVFAFVIDGAIMRRVIEQPVHRIEQLNFDYTRNNPMAFVPIMSCPESLCLECNGKIKFGGVAPSRVISSDHKLQATVLLTLPESKYNRNLGNFQVKVDFLSSNGESLASATQPCRMQFRSWPIRVLLTIFKLVPLVTGYSLESQTLDIKFNRYTEREIPTSCVRVVLEPRAEFTKGGGLPEIYAAYLKLESQLPLLKRILWSWKATVFVWSGIMIFTMGLVFMLLCCAPIFVPSTRAREAPVNSNTSSR